MFLQGIAVSCKLSSAAEAESEILRMVDDCEIFASINQRDGMVAFNEDPELYKYAAERPPSLFASSNTVRFTPSDS